MLQSPTLRRAISCICWLSGAFLATVSLNELLHRSKEAEILFWSVKKLSFCIALFVAAAGAWWGARKLVVPGLPKPLETRNAPVFIFLLLTSVWFFLHISTPAAVGGDIQFQMLGFRQYLSGTVDQFNTQLVPILNLDLAKDRIEPIIWYPPGPMWLLYPFAKAGLTPDLAARWMVFLSFLVGGMGLLVLARHFGFSQKACLAFAVVLSCTACSRDGLGVITPTSADCLGLALFPWLSLATLNLLGGLDETSQISEKAFPFIFLGLSTGALYLIKYSWFIAGATLAFFLGVSVFLLVRKLSFVRRMVLMGGYSIFFLLPFLWLNHHNQQFGGLDALDYNEKGHLGENAFVDMVYGPNFSATARLQELPFSLAAGPGFLLGGNILATRFVHFMRQDVSFSNFFQEKLGTNAHVWALILLCLPFSLVIVWLLGSSLSVKVPYHGAFLITMLVLPLVLLGYLSLKSGFNYIVKDNYRYVIPYSLVFQALLLHKWFAHWKLSQSPFFRNVGAFVIFWVCIFPGTLGIQAAVRDSIAEPAAETPKIPTTQIQALSGGDGQSITFFLNGHGPGKIGIVPREVHISFIKNGGLSRGRDYKASAPVRIIICVEGNLDPFMPEIQEFFKRFPGIQWESHAVPQSLYPKIFVGEMNPTHTE